MTMLVTLAEAKAQIRQTQDHEDADIVLKINAASAAVLAYLKGYDFVDSNGDVDEESVPAQVKQATLALVGLFCRDRDGESMKDWVPGYLPAHVVSLLYPLRDPAIA